MKAKKIAMEQKKDSNCLVEYLLNNTTITTDNIKMLKNYYENSKKIIEEYNKNNGGFVTYVMVLPNGKLYVGQTKNPFTRHSYNNYRYGKIGENLDQLGLTDLKQCIIIYCDYYTTRKDSLEAEEKLIAQLSATNTCNSNVCSRSITHIALNANVAISKISIAPNHYGFVATLKIPKQNHLINVKFSSAKHASRVLNINYAQVMKKVQAAKAVWKSADEVKNIISSLNTAE